MIGHALRLLARPRVALIVNAGQVLEVKVSVDLGGRHARMAEHFLNPPNILTGFKEMRGKRVAEEVGVNGHREALLASAVLDTFLHGSRAEATSIAPHKQRSFVWPAEARALLQPRCNCLEGFAADGDDALFAPFAERSHGLVGLQTVHIESDEFG
jgi:hypothetical protein